MTHGLHRLCWIFVLVRMFILQSTAACQAVTSFCQVNPLCLTVHFICTVFCARQNVVSKSDTQKIEKESLVKELN